MEPASALHEVPPEVDLDPIRWWVLMLYNSLSSGWVRDVPGAFELARAAFLPRSVKRARMRQLLGYFAHIHAEIHRVTAAREAQRREAAAAIEKSRRELERATR